MQDSRSANTHPTIAGVVGSQVDVETVIRAPFHRIKGIQRGLLQCLAWDDQVTAAVIIEAQDAVESVAVWAFVELALQQLKQKGRY